MNALNTENVSDNLGKAGGFIYLFIYSLINAVNGIVQSYFPSLSAVDVQYE